MTQFVPEGKSNFKNQVIAGMLASIPTMIFMKACRSLCQNPGWSKNKGKLSPHFLHKNSLFLKTKVLTPLGNKVVSQRKNLQDRNKLSNSKQSSDEEEKSTTAPPKRISKF